MPIAQKFGVDYDVYMYEVNCRFLFSVYQVCSVLLTYSSPNYDNFLTIYAQ